MDTRIYRFLLILFLFLALRSSQREKNTFYVGLWGRRWN